MIRPGILIRGKITPTIDLKGKTNASIIKIYPELEKIEVTPTLEDQIVKPEGYGFEEVKVKGVTAYIDEDIKAEYIREGVDILGVVGNYKGIETSDATATPEDILQGKTAYINNEKVEGTIQEYDGSFEGGGLPVSIWESKFQTLIDDTLGENITELPNLTTSIRPYAFYGCENMSLTKLPEGITSIGTYAFYNCLKTAIEKLPENLISIGAYAFNKCQKITIKEIPENVTAISTFTFAYCENLTEITLKGDMKTIGGYAFHSCSNLKKIILPNVTTVPTLSNISAFTGTPMKDGDGYIYVPDNLLDKFKVGNGWITYANNIKGISELTYEG